MKYTVWYRKDVGFINVEARSAEEAISKSERLSPEQWEKGFHDCDIAEIYPYSIEETEDNSEENQGITLDIEYE